jgi:hypothetical protein
LITSKIPTFKLASTDLETNALLQSQIFWEAIKNLNIQKPDISEPEPTIKIKEILTPFQMEVREKLKNRASFDRDGFIPCPICHTPVKSKNIIKHNDAHILSPKKKKL